MHHILESEHWLEKYIAETLNFRESHLCSCYDHQLDHINQQPLGLNLSMGSQRDSPILASSVRQPLDKWQMRESTVSTQAKSLLLKWPCMTQIFLPSSPTLLSSRDNHSCQYEVRTQRQGSLDDLFMSVFPVPSILYYIMGVQQEFVE